jgi:hypothetical protein
MTDCRQSAMNPTHQGLTWSAPVIANQAPIVGLGGAGRVVGMGELSLPDISCPQMATLTLNMRNQDNPQTDIGPGNIRARVKYGVGAIPHDEIELDWGFETSIVLPCGRCTIYAYEVGDSTGAANMPRRILLTAQLAAGPRSSLGWPTLTESFVLAAAVPNVLVPPARARRLLVTDYRGIAGSDVTVRITMLNGAVNLFSLATAADSAIRTDGVFLPATTTTVSVTSAAGTGANHIAACFLLDG